jgi:hypothetical protein
VMPPVSAVASILVSSSFAFFVKRLPSDYPRCGRDNPDGLM